MSVRSSLRRGVLAGVVNVFVVLLGLTSLTGVIVQKWLDLPSQSPGAWALLLSMAWWGGAMAVQRTKPESWRETLIGGLVAGAPHGLIMAVLTWGLGSLIEYGIVLRKWLVQITPEKVGLLTLGFSPVPAALVACSLLITGSVAGAAVAYASRRYRWREAWSSGWRAGRAKVVTAPAVQSFVRHRYSRHVLYGIGLVALLGAPFVVGQYWNYVLGTVGIYVVLGLGLNVVVGMAGLLNLGYAAFFAIGAYTVAILTAPQYNIMWSFWVALPIGIGLATFTGVLLSLPVLRMRGDYLAIVTLGFGEIIRILAKSDALTPLSGGPQGIRAVGGPGFFGLDLSPMLNRVYFSYIILGGIALGILITFRLQDSRLGRALMAMREDEDVAQAVGVYTLKYKVLAFSIGAAFAGLGGVIFAARNRYTGPEDFALLVSVNVLCLVIIGGINSVPGIVLGALALKGLPEILRELEDYRMLAFGALLVIMMILRPEGLWPSSRTKAELKRGESLGGGVTGVGQGMGS